MTRRRLAQPGPALAPRVEAVAGRGREIAVTLAAGLTLHEAIVRALAPHGIASASLGFGDVTLAPLCYYIPAVVEAGPIPRFGYSEAQRPEGGGRVESAHASFGLRDGEPFVHCHAIWRERDGRWHGGHVVPPESVLAEAVPARVAVLPAARLLSELDPETDYQLFHPVPTGVAAGEGRRMVQARVKPNEDLCEAVEAACRDAGFATAALSGLGSLIGARFADGSGHDDPASEVLIVAGAVAPDEAGSPRAAIDICFSGFDGLAHRGRLLRGENPVCITFELLIEEGSGRGPAT